MGWCSPRCGIPAASHPAFCRRSSMSGRRRRRETIHPRPHLGRASAEVGIDIDMLPASGYWAGRAVINLGPSTSPVSEPAPIRVRVRDKEESRRRWSWRAWVKRRPDHRLRALALAKAAVSTGSTAAQPESTTFTAWSLSGTHAAASRWASRLMTFTSKITGNRVCRFRGRCRWPRASATCREQLSAVSWPASELTLALADTSMPPSSRPQSGRARLSEPSPGAAPSPAGYHPPRPSRRLPRRRGAPPPDGIRATSCCPRRHREGRRRAWATPVRNTGTRATTWAG